MLLSGNGDGTFSTTTLDPGSGTGPDGIVLGDFDNNGSLDIATANQNAGSVSVLLNTAVVAVAEQPLQNVSWRGSQTRTATR